MKDSNGKGRKVSGLSRFERRKIQLRKEEAAQKELKNRAGDLRNYDEIVSADSFGESYSVMVDHSLVAVLLLGHPSGDGEIVAVFDSEDYAQNQYDAIVKLASMIRQDVRDCS